ncbi:sensor domain-containing diguanylate cyclase [Vibrio viridaestus]|uniref:diguanylate cyclase n=1 Tax=Vibrio viridaestus TaxID=2487322 RepID=A0A3N9TKQ9_9VIBR|nr:diguanylate cyclase [Vibrio viridaestus]RQW64701.1 sensor domain-containing diguanylate cyclase [Vibrio viridaestus]
MQLHSSLYKLLLVMLTFGSLIFATDVITRQFIQSGQTETIALANAAKKSAERQLVFDQFFDRSKVTLLAIHNSDAFSQFFYNSSAEPLKQLALALAQSQQDIMKIRFIDQNGMEVIRIDRDRIGDNAKIVADSALQNKAHRYFFFDSKKQPLNKVWFSNIDLNEDNGRVEIPFKPTLRSVLPISNKNEFAGILLVNYFMQPLFDRLSDTPLYDLILTDRDGEILLHHDSERNWSSYTDKQSIKSELPEFDQVIQNHTFQGNGFFSRELSLPNQQNLFLILALKDEYSIFQKALSSKKLLYSSALTVLIMIVFGVIFSLLLNRLFTDYREREKHIVELTKLNQQVNNLLIKNQVFMDMASDGIHVLDKNGNIVVFSESFAKMLGYSQDEMSKLNVSDWDAMIPKDEIIAAMNSFTNEPRTLETKHKRKDGSIFDVEIHCKWIHTNEGEDLFYASSRDITERLRLENELHRLASTDTLTQLPTRRVFMERLDVELERCVRQPQSLITVAMLDLDDFKVINDTYGHGMGDKMLVTVASIIKDEIRKVDIAGRLGGEEFGLILTGTSEESALHFANRLRTRVEQATLVSEGDLISCTISIGLTQIKPSDSSTDMILERADKALYSAKNNGRNRAEVFHGDTTLHSS